MQYISVYKMEVLNAFLEQILEVCDPNVLLTVEALFGDVGVGATSLIAKLGLMATTALAL